MFVCRARICVALIRILNQIKKRNLRDSYGKYQLTDEINAVVYII